MLDRRFEKQKAQMVNDVRKKQPWREELLSEDDEDDDVISPTTYSKNRFANQFDEPGNDQTPAQLRENRKQRLISKIWEYR